jgi:hypothetical protein
LANSENGDLIPYEAEQEAICEIVALRAQGKALRAIAHAVAAKGHTLSHEGVAGVFKGVGRLTAEAVAVKRP